MAYILIADDDPDVRALVRVALTRTDHVLMESADGHETIAKILDMPPDLLVLDLMMPGADGFDVLEAMVEAGVRMATKVLVLTAKAGESDRATGLSLGADRYVTKPFDPVELASAIEELLDSSGEEIAQQRDEELERANLLSQLESLLGAE
ncbi:MAG: response regulator [Actinomycetota bacterium]|nr:response regulator [Actinomycetota bacterium]